MTMVAIYALICIAIGLKLLKIAVDWARTNSDKDKN